MMKDMKLKKKKTKKNKTTGGPRARRVIVQYCGKDIEKERKRKDGREGVTVWMCRCHTDV